MNRTNNIEVSRDVFYHLDIVYEYLSTLKDYSQINTQNSLHKSLQNSLQNPLQSEQKAVIPSNRLITASLPTLYSSGKGSVCNTSTKLNLAFASICKLMQWAMDSKISVPNLEQAINQAYMRDPYIFAVDMSIINSKRIGKGGGRYNLEIIR